MFYTMLKMPFIGFLQIAGQFSFKVRIFQEKVIQGLKIIEGVLKKIVQRDKR